MSNVAGKVGAVYMQSGAPAVQFTDAATTALTLSNFQISNPVIRYLDESQAITVSVNDVPVLVGFTIDYFRAVVSFDDPLLVSDVVTLDGYYFQVEQVAGFFNWKLSLNTNIVSVSAFAGTEWKENQPTIKDWSATAEKFFVTNDISSRLGDKVILALFTDTGVGRNRYEGYAHINKDSIDCTFDGIIQEPIEFIGIANIFYQEG